jgi:hypothetical protein
MTQSETQRIGYTMQQLVWKPANNVRTKSVAGMVAKLIIVALIALIVFIVTALVTFYTSALSWKWKLIATVAGCVWLIYLLYF